jgi:hypothetical protein
MNSLAATKIIILRELLKKKGRISSYSLYRKLKIPVAEFMRIIGDLEKDDFVNFDDDWLTITASGNAFLIQSRPKSDQKRGIPRFFLRDAKLSLNTPYIPSRSRLDVSLLSK